MATIKKTIYQTTALGAAYGWINITPNGASSVTITVGVWEYSGGRMPVFEVQGVTTEQYTYNEEKGYTYTFAVQALNGSWTIRALSGVFDNKTNLFVLDAPNTAPTAPTSFTYPDIFYADVDNRISWSGATDADGNLAGYRVDKSMNLGATWTQIYEGSQNFTTDKVAYSQHGQNVMYRVKAYDSFGSESAWYIAPYKNVVSNLAPTAPTGFTYPSVFRSEVNNTLSWSGATDADGNLSGYIVERCIDLVNWTKIYQGAAATTTDRLDYNQAVNVQYRVKAYDSQGAESAWYTAPVKPVVNNRPPTAPPSITVPVAVYGGEPVTITWSASSDSESNISLYVLERNVNNTTWTVVTSVNALTYVDTAGTDWSTVAYRVKARDEYGDESAYATSPTRNVDSNKAPIITCDKTNLGSVTGDITVAYSVSDPDGDTISVSEYIDSTLIRKYTAADGASQTLSLTGLAFMKVLNGGHSLKITATDSRGKSATHTITFVKQVYEAVVMLTPAQSLGTTLGVPITIAVMSIVAQFGDSEVEILATNNAKDANPVWEDATAAFLAGNNYVFTNTTITNGNYYAFKITARRPAGGTGGHMSYMGGAFK